jgi:hypothetical protein
MDLFCHINKGLETGGLNQVKAAFGVEALKDVIVMV